MHKISQPIQVQIWLVTRQKKLCAALITTIQIQYIQTMKMLSPVSEQASYLSCLHKLDTRGLHVSVIISMHWAGSGGISINHLLVFESCWSDCSIEHLVDVSPLSLLTISLVSTESSNMTVGFIHSQKMP